MVVVVDTSTDVTVDTLARTFSDRIRGVYEFRANDPNAGSGEVRGIHSERRLGVAAARNAGVRLIYAMGCEVFNPAKMRHYASLVHTSFPFDASNEDKRCDGLWSRTGWIPTRSVPMSARRVIFRGELVSSATRSRRRG